MLEQRDPISEIEQLVEELESYAANAPWYLPSKVVIPDEEFFNITGRIREVLPVELSAARETLEKRDLILKNAQEEHKRIMDTAERRLEDMTSQDQVVITAQEQANRIIQNAKMEAESMKRDALLYTAELLEDMERQFGETIKSLQKGREFLESEINQTVDDNLSQLSEPDTPEIEAAESEDDGTTIEV